MEWRRRFLSTKERVDRRLDEALGRWLPAALLRRRGGRVCHGGAHLRAVAIEQDRELARSSSTGKGMAMRMLMEREPR